MTRGFDVEDMERNIGKGRTNDMDAVISKCGCCRTPAAKTAGQGQWQGLAFKPGLF